MFPKQTANAAQFLEENLKTTFIPSGESRQVEGVTSKKGASVICGECSDDGGGSSGQCACSR